MENTLEILSQTLSKMIGHHRKLLEVVRLEHDALTDFQQEQVAELTLRKESLIAGIQETEILRQQCIRFLARKLARPEEELTLAVIVQIVQDQDEKRAEQLRTSYNTLRMLIDRIQDQNRKNAKMAEHAIGHLKKMRENVVGETAEKKDTYTGKGQRQVGKGESRLLSTQG